MASILLILFFLIFPALILYLCGRFKALDRIGPVVICYIAGILAGNTGLLPANALALQDIMTTLTVPLALPLMFFSMNLRGFKKTAGKTFLSFVLAGLAVIIASGISYFIFKDLTGRESWKMAGMLIGCYTGGTPNLAAIGTALNIDTTSYVAVHAADVVVGGVFLLLLLSVGHKTLGLFLPKYRSVQKASETVDMEQFGDTFKNFRSEHFLPLLKAFGLAVLIMALGGGLSFLVPQEVSMTVAILAITTLSVACSFIPSVRKIKMTFQLGYYFILVFSLVVSSMANFQELVKTAPAVIGYVSCIIAVSCLLHTLFSALFRIDRDTHIITTTALVFSPPFVPLVAAAIKNKEIVINGVIIGVAGWIAGNYLGISIAYLLKAWGG